MSLKNKIILGIDTSCYTTSIAAINLQGDILLDKKIQLKVKKGDRGLRQSDGVFQHVENLGRIFSGFQRELQGSKVVALCASKTPRPVKGSYMPVFNAGANFAEAISQVLGVKCYATSHQEGHIKVIENESNLKSDRFLAVHISGGTSEILLVDRNGAGFDIRIVGGSKDISAGQLLDRIGVRLGYSFPAGKAMDENAIEFGEGKCIFKINSKEGYINLSGVEAQAFRLIEANKADEKYISYNVLKAISIKMARALEHLSAEHGCTDVLFAGGVASSKFLRNHIPMHIETSGIKDHWGSASYSSDNAAGVALIGRELYLKDGDEKG